MPAIGRSCQNLDFFDSIMAYIDGIADFSLKYYITAFLLLFLEYSSLRFIMYLKCPILNLVCIYYMHQFLTLV